MGEKLEESEGGMDGVGGSRGEVEDGEKRGFDMDRNKKSKIKMLLEFWTIAIVLQILIPVDDLPPNDVLCRRASLVNWEKHRSSSGIYKD